MRKTKSSRLTLNRNTVRALSYDDAAAVAGGAPSGALCPATQQTCTCTHMKSKCGSCDSIDVNCPILSYIRTGCCTA